MKISKALLAIDCLGILLIALLTGCSILGYTKVKKPESPSVTVSPTGSVEIKGDSKVPPVVDTKSSNANFTIPAGSLARFNQALGEFTLYFDKDSKFESNKLDTSIQGPTAFEPPKGPTPEEEEAANRATIFYFLMVGGLGGAAFGLFYGWTMVAWGSGAIAAASGFAIFLNKSLQDNPWITHIIVGGAVAITVGVIIYFTKVKPLSKGKVVATTVVTPPAQ